MSAEIKKSGYQIFVGDFVGSCSDSPNGAFSIAWYCSKSRGRMDDKHFVLLNGDIPMVWGEVTSRIYEGKVSDTGRFALHVIGKTNQSTIRFFESNGQEFSSKQLRNGLSFFDLSSDGRLLFWSSRNEFRCVDLSTMSETFSFQLESRFNPTAAKLDSDGVTLLLKHWKKGWYRFDRNGGFLDREKWLLDYIQDCDGPALCQIVGDLYKNQGAKDPEEIRTYAQWIEESLRRGITDSYYFKVSSVYEFLARLYTEAGDLDKAAQAKEDAEQHLDGFALVDRAMSRFKEIGNPPNQELANQLARDLERATTTQRLLEYPNYVGKLYRTKAEILELLGEKDGAMVAYQKALEANPQAGCKKQLERLTESPVILPEKPKPKPTEERVRLDKLTMFHFRCPVCGGTPKEIKMQDYLAEWNESEIGRLEQLFAVLLATTQELKGSKANSAQRFQAAADDLVMTLSERLKDKPPVQSPVLMAAAPKTLVVHIECPLCQKPSGLRRKDNYFTVWSEACRVQSSNLFFETGVILLGLNSLNLAWVSDEMRQFCGKFKSQVFRAGEALGMMPCPQCGRFTSCLYGATRSDPEKGMCRWCLDSSGANQITITVNLADIAKKIGQPVAAKTETEAI
jgi:tetratricopeptide (TPR) repeat protein